MPESSAKWVSNQLAPTGILEGGVRYRKHGYGCEVFLPDGAVDFDFGERGQIDGFDPWRLKRFAGKRLGEYGFGSEQELEMMFKDAVRTRTLIYSGYTLYYLRRPLVAVEGP